MAFADVAFAFQYNVDEDTAYAAELRKIKPIETPDDYTIVCKLVVDRSDISNNAAFPWMWVAIAAVVVILGLYFAILSSLFF